MNNFSAFIFSSYDFNETTKTLTLTYSFDDHLTFIESYRFDFEFKPGYNPAALKRAMQNLFFVAGVSYYKAYPVEKIKITAGETDAITAEWLSTTYQKGLGEFYYVNQLDPKSPVEFPATSDIIEPQSTPSDGLLIGVGGGKDSLVSIELLRNQPNVATWSLNHKAQLSPLVDEIGLEHFWVERTFDTTLIEHNKKGARNGHVPISAIIGCVGTIVAVLTGKQDVVVSNEQSANEPTLDYEGIAINHQYSKSSDYERLYQKVLKHHFGDSQRYYSFLRPLSELHIAELFAQLAFEKYRRVFSSCNRAFVMTSDHMSWCGECSKCAFTFLILSPFIEHSKLEQLWGKNLLVDPALEATYKKLLGIEGDKPLDCVGEIKESRTAMQLAQKMYPQLVKYNFDLPVDYDYRNLFAHDMPAELYQILVAATKGLHKHN